MMQNPKDKKGRELGPKEINERKNIKKLLNIFSIFVEKPYLINKFFKESEDNKFKSFTFNVKGKKKVFQTSEDKNRHLSFFEHLYKVSI